MRFYTHRASRPTRSHARPTHAPGTHAPSQPANPLARTPHPRPRHARTEPANRPRHLRRTLARTNPHPINPRAAHPVTADHEPHLFVRLSISVLILSSQIPSLDFFPSRLSRFLQGDSGGAGVGGGVGLRRRLSLSICTRPFFLPPASTSCVLIHSLGSRDSQTRLMRGEGAARRRA
jgi:hypothetical protein